MEKTIKPINKYIIESCINWIVDNDLTPYIIVNAEYPTVQVPWDLVREGKILLDISAKACSGFLMDEEAISFVASFSGKRTNVYIPIGSIEIIYAKENGMGMPLPEYPKHLIPSVENKEEENKPEKKDRPVFTVVK